MCFCDQFKFDPFESSVNNVVNFLQMLVDEGLGYSAINTARSAISSVIKMDVKIKYNSRLKTTRPGFHVCDVVIQAYKESELCLVKTLNHYIDRTRSIRSDNKLFIATVKPHKSVTRDTISRWIKLVMNNSGIDVTQFWDRCDTILG
ncbi:hypothetical protein FSP39_013771 [Pinctada imbricata]|uniref:Uncharacterized protein n=1 Tax=Pinctada imbricata TaxID=66713 RepID=A0AA89C3S5_PINIB|nr:hypothetical protein FSP39_013771 [Pinctada imbricata]